MKQTAVEWLEKKFYFTNGQLIDIDFEQAKAMEKQQIIDAVGAPIIGEQYYNENFKPE